MSGGGRISGRGGCSRWSDNTVSVNRRSLRMPPECPSSRLVAGLRHLPGAQRRPGRRNPDSARGRALIQSARISVRRTHSWLILDVVCWGSSRCSPIRASASGIPMEHVGGGAGGASGGAGTIGAAGRGGGGAAGTTGDAGRGGGGAAGTTGDAGRGGGAGTVATAGLGGAGGAAGAGGRGGTTSSGGGAGGVGGAGGGTGGESGRGGTGGCTLAADCMAGQICLSERVAMKNSSSCITNPCAPVPRLVADRLAGARPASRRPERGRCGLRRELTSRADGHTTTDGARAAGRVELPQS